jgi:3-methyladenine DNA glycosylase AlkD
MRQDLRRQLSYFRKRLRAGGTRERAVKEKSYLKSPFRFHGASLPAIEGLAREFRRANRHLGPEYVFDLCRGLWQSGYHEEKTLAIKLLSLYPDFLGLDEMPLLEGMLEASTGWDHVDAISIHLVGSVLGRDRRAYRYLRKWGRSENFWMRRASLISQILLFRDGRGDKRLFFGLAGRMMEEKEFFVRKAIGWALREMSKSDPDGVFHYLMEARQRASGLTMREASKRLPERQRALLLKK